MDKQSRQAADEDFMRSLGQLENLLENEPAAGPAPELEETETSYKFGGSILDAIPLAQRLGNRLENGLSPSDAEDSEPTTGI